MKVRRRRSSIASLRRAALLCGMGTLMQLGACNIGQISTSTTIDGREALISLIRGAILTPIDAFITNAVNQFFDN